MGIDQFAECSTQWKLIVARLSNVPAHAEYLGTRAFFCANRFVSSGTVDHDVRHAAQCFNVVDDGRARIQACDCGEWWARTWLTQFAFNAIQQRRFLATNIGTGAEMNVYLARPTAAADIFADPTGSPRFFDLGFQIMGQIPKFASTININS